MVPVDERKLAGKLKLPFKKFFGLRRQTNGIFYTNVLERNIAVPCSVFSRSCPGSEKSNFACRQGVVASRSRNRLTGGAGETERYFQPETGKPLSRNFRDFTGAAWALSRISLMPGMNRIHFPFLFIYNLVCECVCHHQTLSLPVGP